MRIIWRKHLWEILESCGCWALGSDGHGPWPITCTGTDDSSIGHDAGLQPLRSFSIDSTHRSRVEPTASATTASTFSWCVKAPQPAPKQSYAEMLISPHYSLLCSHPEEKGCRILNEWRTNKCVPACFHEMHQITSSGR